MILAVTLLWLGCLIVFLASPHQKFIKKRLSQMVCWAIFTVLALVSWFLYCNVFDGVIAGLMVLSFVMIMWPTIVVAHAHCSLKLLAFTCCGAVIFSVIAQLGAVNVG